MRLLSCGRSQTQIAQVCPLHRTETEEANVRPGRSEYLGITALATGERDCLVLPAEVIHRENVQSPVSLFRPIETACLITRHSKLDFWFGERTDFDGSARHGPSSRVDNTPFDLRHGRKSRRDTTAEKESEDRCREFPQPHTVMPFAARGERRNGGSTLDYTSATALREPHVQSAPDRDEESSRGW
jgi:hypothetical protein